MECSQEIDKIAEALALANSKISNPAHNASVSAGKAGSYTHSNLNSITDMLRPVLSSHGISILQSVKAGEMLTRLIHTSGQWIQTSYPFNVNSHEAKSLASYTTYMRKQSLAMTCFIYGDKDADAKGFYDDEGNLITDAEKVKEAKREETKAVQTAPPVNPIPLKQTETPPAYAFTPEEKKLIWEWKSMFGVVTGSDIYQYIIDIGGVNQEAFDRICLRAMKNEAAFLEAFEASKKNILSTWTQ